MKRPVLIACIVAFAAGLIITLIWSLRPRSPRYQGRPVTAWIREAYSYNATQAKVDQAREAVRSAGTNALPFWLELLSDTNESRFVTLWNSTVGRSARLHRETSSEKWDYALFAMYVLGPDAKSAIPELTKLLDCRVVNPNSDACILLLNLGPEGVRAVTNALANTNHFMRFNIAYNIGAWNGRPPYSTIFYSAAYVRHSNWEWPTPVMNSVVPALVRCLHDHDPVVQAYSAESLSLLGNDSEKVVRTLSNQLGKSTEQDERAALLQALGICGPDAKPARAEVAAFLNDTNSEVRTAASNALTRIDSKKIRE